MNGIVTQLPIIAFPVAAYNAIADPQNPGMHLEIQSAPIPVPLGARQLKLFASRDSFPDGDNVFKCRTDISSDGGITWPLLFGFSASGGVAHYPDGSVANVSGHISPLPQGVSHVRVTIIPLVDLTTGVQVTFQ